MTSPPRYQLLLVGLLWSALFLITPPEANAGARIGRAPVSLGLGDGLVGYWSFDGKDTVGVTAYDRSGQGNNGTLVNGPARTIGKIGQALNLDGANDTLSLGVVLSNINVKTISAWIRPEEVGGAQEEIISKNGCAGAGFHGWFFHLPSASPGTLQYEQCNGGTSGIWGTPANSVTRNAWHHMVLIYDRTNVNNDPVMYIDGASQSVNEVQTPDAVATDDSGVEGWIGSAEATEFLNGTLDDVRVYNRALTPDEIKRLYKMGATMKVGVASNNLTHGLVGYWSFDGRDTVGVTAYDRSGQGNNGTLTNTPTRAIGKLGQGIEFGFNVTDRYIDAATPVSLTNLTQKTACAWIYPRSFGTSGDDTSILSKGGGGLGWGIQLADDDGGVKALYYAHAFDVSNGQWRSPANQIKQNTWHHVCALFDRSSSSNNPEMYIDGAFQTVTELAPSPAGTTVNDSGENILIGNWNESSPSSFDGIIDDVRLYNRMLSADEIKRLYKMGSTAKVGVVINNGSLAQGLVGYWSFDGKDVVGVTAYDRSGQGNNGTLTNGPSRAIGKIGQAIDTRGTGFVQLGTGGLDNISRKTITAWINPSSLLAGDNVFIVGAIDDVGSTPPWVFAVCSDTVNCPSTSQTFMYSHAWGGGTGTWASPADIIKPDKWQLVAVSYDDSSSGNDPVLYYNGSPVAITETRTPSGSEPDDSCCKKGIAGSIPFPGEFNGRVDDVRVYNRALTADEIKRLYLMGR